MSKDGQLRSELVFLRHDGTGWGKSHGQRLLVDARTITKIDPAISLHELRHTYASALAQASDDLTDDQQTVWAR